MSGVQIRVRQDHRRLPGLRGRELIVEIDRLEGVEELWRDLARHNSVHRLELRLDMPLSLFQPPPARFSGIELWLAVSCLGDFKEAVARLPFLKACDILVLFPDAGAESCRSAKVLASLGVRSGVDCTAASTDWDALDDLAHYHIYRRVERVGIIPFSQLEAEFDPAAHWDLGGLYGRGLGQYRLDDAEVLRGYGLPGGRGDDGAAWTVDQMFDAEFRAWDAARRLAWDRHFIDDTPCAACEGFRLCLGRYCQAGLAGPEGCPAAAFFRHWLEGLDFHRRTRPGKGH